MPSAVAATSAICSMAGALAAIILAALQRVEPSDEGRVLRLRRASAARRTRHCLLRLRWLPLGGVMTADDSGGFGEP